MEFSSLEQKMYALHKTIWDKVLKSSKKSLASSDNYIDTVIFDVGANKGQSLVEYAILFPNCEIHAFEPNIDLNTHISREMQRFPNNKFNLLNFGLGSKEELMDFNIYTDDGVSSFLKAEPFLHALNTDSWELRSHNPMLVKTLDTYILESKVVPNILKIDTQGFDLEVLLGGQGMLTEGAPSIIGVEVLFAKNYEKQGYFWDIANLLFNHGYRLYDFTRLVHTSRGNLYFGDATFLSPTAWQSLDLV
jgi:FkbM family methyltransferase